MHGANLHGANLSGSILRDVDLRDVDLSGSILRDVDLRDVDLCDVDLCGADLSGSILRDVDLRDSILRDVDLSGSILRDVDLRDVDLSYANLSYTNLSYTNLHGANLHGVDLRDADLRGAEEVPYVPMACPEEGDFIGWKRAGDKIVKLHIPQDALRSSSTTRKCRCNKAEVIEIYNIDGTIADERIISSSYDSSFTYEVGKTVEVQDFDTNRWKECTRGIHFFINRQEAINY